MFNYYKAFYTADDETYRAYFDKAKNVDDTFYENDDARRSDGYFTDAELSCFMQQCPKAPIGFKNRASLFLYEINKYFS